MGRTRKIFGLKAEARSRITNGRDLLPSIDGRSTWSRRFRDLVGLLQSDLGGEAAPLSEGQKALVRRASTLALELERLEVRFARNGGAKPHELETFQRATNTLRRTIECLGIHRGRIARDVTPTLEQYIAAKYSQPDDEQEAAE